ncbi:hypothetical protein Tco_0070615 [Tanacetum coccineum]
MEKAQTESSLAKPNTDDDMNIELNKEFLMELRSNAYYRTFDEYVDDHIAKVLEMLDLIKIPNVDSHRLCMKVFPLSLADDARQWKEDLEAYLSLLKQTRGELAHTKLTVELADRIVKHLKGIAENILIGIGKFIFPVDFIILDMPEDVKVPLILERPFLSTTHAKIDVFKRKITLRVGDEKIIFKSMKPASSLIKRVYMLSLEERMELDLEARLMGETLVLNRSLDPLYGDYIKLNDLNVPLELRRYQVDDLIPTIEEVVENIDGYRDQDMGDVIFGEPFCKASCVEARRFDRLITIHNVIMEYLVKISKKARILELERRHLKMTVLTSYTPYPSRKIRRICACTSQETTKIQSPIRRHANHRILIEEETEFLMELRSNAYHRTFDEDVVEHIAKVLEMLNLIKIPNVDSHRLCMKVFPLSLADDAR